MKLAIARLDILSSPKPCYPTPMSSYLHIIPVNDEASAYLNEQGIDPKKFAAGRMPTKEEFDEATGGVQSSDYRLLSDQMSLRRGEDTDLYTILSKLVKTCGSQIVLNDDLQLFIFEPSTTLEQFRDSKVS